MHKFIVVFTICLLLAFVGTNGGGVLGIEEQVRQCTCEEQNNCFAKLKETTEACFVQCGNDAELLAAINNTGVNIEPCMQMRKKMPFEIHACLNKEIVMNGSCLNSTGEQVEMVDFLHFEQLLLNLTRPTGKQVIETFEKAVNDSSTGNGNNKFLETATIVNKCTHSCAVEKFNAMNCYKETNCSLKLDDAEQQIKQTMNKCMQKVNPNKISKEICQCFIKAGVGNLEDFCSNLEKQGMPTELQ